MPEEAWRHASQVRDRPSDRGALVPQDTARNEAGKKTAVPFIGLERDLLQANIFPHKVESPADVGFFVGIEARLDLSRDSKREFGGKSADGHATS
jgi:hypothetical protein